MMSEQNKTIIRRIYEEIFNAGDLDLVREVIASEAIDHAPGSRSSLPIGKHDAIKDFLVEVCTAVPDAHWTVQQMQADRDMVVVQTTMSGSHHGEFRGLRPTGRHFTITGVDRIRVSASKIVEHWGELDMASLQRQLAVPPIGATRHEALPGET
jgi:predicted ester cyclase